MAKKEITDRKIKQQAWKFFFVLFVWPIFLFLLPLAFAKLGLWALVAMIFPGLYLYTWLGYLMHEAWHKYVPNIPNAFFYNVFSWMLITDPQVYHVLHWYHHSQVNSWSDSEFHPIGEIRNVWLRRIYNFFELFLGIVFLYIMAVARIPFNPQFKNKFNPLSAVVSVLLWGIIYVGIGFASAFVFNIPAHLVAIVLCANVLLDSIFLHLSQLVEHGNLIVEGNYKTRNLRTRNLRNKGAAARVFLFLTHGDSHEHVLHHTSVKVYSRPFPGSLPMPEGAVWISFGDFLLVLWDMLRGRVNVQK
jgi:fatty acid desaturase